MMDYISSQEDLMGSLISDDSMDLDLISEFLLEDWQESSDLLNQFDSGPFPCNSFNSGSPQLQGIMGSNLNTKDLKDQNRYDHYSGKEAGAFLARCKSSFENPIESFSANQSLNLNSSALVGCTAQSSHGYHEHRSVAAGSVTSTSRVSSIGDRLTTALEYIKESNNGGEILVQIWMPVRMGHKLVLSTCGQPFWLDSSCQRLVSYRSVSTQYQFPAEDNSEVALGLPGRVFVGELPEWTPDVRLFRSHEYPRVNHAQRYDVRGSIALPVFERGGRSCLGVVEVVLTTEKINYCSDLDNICKALQAVNLRSSQAFGVSHVKVKNHYFQAALLEIHEVLRVACETYKLPLAQTWVPCIQQGKQGSRHTDKNYKKCISTADSACYVRDPCILGFHKACSEHHLFEGQGVAGKAFAINQPCFASDITAYCRTEYPLSHLAKLFKLHGAVAIRLQSICAVTIDFILEFFLPTDSVRYEEQRYLLDLLSSTIHQVSQNLRVVTDVEMEGEVLLRDSCISRSSLISKDTFQGPIINEVLAEVLPTSVTLNANLSWLSDTAQVLQSDERSLSAYVSSQFGNRGIRELCVKSHCKDETVLPESRIFSEGSRHQKDSVHVSNYNENYIAPEIKSPKTEENVKRRHAKAEKAITLQLLQQYFAGSLKDAARVLGVCPTTLKRICRQHGITRWPSRKIKKVSHSLKKLQVVIDSVEGVDKSYQFGSLYGVSPDQSNIHLDFLNGTDDIINSTLNQESSPETSNVQSVYQSAHTSTSNSPSSSCSQNSGSRSRYSTGEAWKGNAGRVAVKESLKVSQCDLHEIENTELGFCVLAEKPHIPVTSTHSRQSFTSDPPGIPSCLLRKKCTRDLLAIKATCGEDKVRFKLQPDWSLQHLKQEIAKRFNITNPSLMELKYLDDDSERILLTCEEDLQECVNIYKSSSIHIIKMYVHHNLHP